MKGRHDLGNLIADADNILRRAAEEPHCAFVILFSGGHDSATCCHVAAEWLKRERIENWFVAHINTGIGIPETRQYVRDYCRRYEFPYREFCATENVNAKGDPDPQVYEELVVQHGFPGPDHHKKMFNRLKERQLRRIERECGATTRRPIVYVSGVRKEESSRRFRNVDEIQRRGRVTWCAPLTNWTKANCRAYMAENCIPENEVVKKLCMSGECLCGAFARGEEERAELRALFPEVEAEITRIEERVIAAGFPWKWHEAPPSWWGKMKAAEKAGQIDAFDHLRDEVLEEQGFMPLCTSCNNRFANG